MLTIVCGEDNVQSRSHILHLKAEYEKKGYEIQEISDLDINDTASLFAQRRIYFIQNLNKKINRKNTRVMDKVTKIIQDTNIEVVDWEDQITSRELKITGASIMEFKPDQNIFKLLDACYPKNIKNFIRILHELSSKVDEGFVFIMLIRHVKNLLLVKSGIPSAKLAPWQAAKLRHLANLWQLEPLIAFYDGLFRIDVSAKTGKNPYSLGKSLDILACYFL